MSAKPILGQTAEIAGPKKAFIIPKPEVAASMIRRAKRPLLIVGSNSREIQTKDGDLFDSAIRVLKTGRMTVVATGHLIKEFRDRNAEGVHSMQLMNLGDRLRDPDWEGLDGEGPYDLVVFVGTDRIEPRGQLDVDQTVNYVLPDLRITAFLSVAVQFLDDRGSIINRTFLLDIVPPELSGS